VKFICPRQRLVTALQAISAVVPTRGIKEVYESVRIEASRSQGLILLGTDIEVTVRYVIAPGDGLEVLEEGTLLAPARRLAAILHELPDEPVTIAWTSGSCSVKSASGSYRIAAGDPADFPAIEILGTERSVTIARDVLKEVVQRTSFAAAKEKMRYALNGILIIAKGQELQAVATDGRRLAHVTASCTTASGNESRAIVPTRALTQLVRILPDGAEVVHLAFSESQVAATAGPVSIQARLVEGAFPNFDEVIPVNCERKARLNREKFAAGLRRAAVLFQTGGAGAGSSVRLEFAEGADLVLTSSVTDVGEATATIPCTYTGKTEAVGYNAQYLLDALAVCTTEEVSFEFNSSQSPGRLTDGERFTYVVMPVTL
jgi:DNA polymerase-3 subunit beta